MASVGSWRNLLEKQTSSHVSYSNGKLTTMCRRRKTSRHRKPQHAFRNVCLWHLIDAPPHALEPHLKTEALSRGLPLQVLADNTDTPFVHVVIAKERGQQMPESRCHPGSYHPFSAEIDAAAEAAIAQSGPR